MEYQVELHRAHLKARMRGQDEGLLKLAKDIERLMRLAYPGTTAQPMKDLLAKDHFTDALPDEDMRLQKRHSRPASLRDVLHLSLELESCDVASRCRRNVRGTQLEEDVLEVRQTATKATNPALQQVLEILRELQTERQAGSRRRAEMPWSVGSATRRNTQGDGAQTAAAIPYTKLCHPSGKRPVASLSGQRLATNERSAPSPSLPASASSLSLNSDSPPTVYSLGSKSLRTAVGLTAPGSIAERKCQVTIDTGSNIALLQPDIMRRPGKELMLQSVGHQLRTVTGETSPIHGICTSEVTVGSFSRPPIWSGLQTSPTSAF